VRLPGLPKRDTSRLGLEDPPFNSNSTELGPTSVAGWWGIPFGPVFTIQSLWRNLNGGIDVTDAFRRAEV
jgi:hypothetical protein